MSKRILLLPVVGLFLFSFGPMVTVHAQDLPNSAAIPVFRLVPAAPVELPSAVDSNSPAFWQFEWGQDRLHVLTSWENPSISQGLSIRRLQMPRLVSRPNTSNGGWWMESVLQAGNGTLYGYYHNEPLGLCPGTKKTAPRIGAARSLDNGLSWEDLGIILEATGPLDCTTPNEFFAGGVGDLNAVLNQEETDVYFFFTNYGGTGSRQGVAVARTLWALRDFPVGNVSIWDGRAWRYPSATQSQMRRSLEPRPIYPAAISWHDRSGYVDSFWGPSVHWNRFLNQYVMLLNRAADSAFTQEGIYIAFSPVLDEPARWTKPVKIMDGGNWYPQVIGLEKDRGTDKVAGSVARFFTRGRSEYFLVFPAQN